MSLQFTRSMLTFLILFFHVEAQSQIKPEEAESGLKKALISGDMDGINLFLKYGGKTTGETGIITVLNKNYDPSEEQQKKIYDTLKNLLINGGASLPRTLNDSADFLLALKSELLIDNRSEWTFSILKKLGLALDIREESDTIYSFLLRKQGSREQSFKNLDALYTALMQNGITCSDEDIVTMVSEDRANLSAFGHFESLLKIKPNFYSLKDREGHPLVRTLFRIALKASDSIFVYEKWKQFEKAISHVPKEDKLGATEKVLFDLGSFSISRLNFGRGYLSWEATLPEKRMEFLIRSISISGALSAKHRFREIMHYPVNTMLNENFLTHLGPARVGQFVFNLLRGIEKSKGWESKIEFEDLPYPSLLLLRKILERESFSLERYGKDAPRVAQENWAYIEKVSEEFQTRFKNGTIDYQIPYLVNNVLREKLRRVYGAWAIRQRAGANSFTEKEIELIAQELNLTEALYELSRAN